jgi:hypothetical protein
MGMRIEGAKVGGMKGGEGGCCCDAVLFCFKMQDTTYDTTVLFVLPVVLGVMFRLWKIITTDTGYQIPAVLYRTNTAFARKPRNRLPC